MSLKSLMQKINEISASEGALPVSEGEVKKTQTGIVHRGTYGTQYDGDDDQTSKQDVQVKRGRGRPRKGADSDTGKVAKYDNAGDLQSFMIGNLPGNKLPGKTTVKNKLDDKPKSSKAINTAIYRLADAACAELECEYKDLPSAKVKEIAKEVGVQVADVKKLLDIDAMKNEGSGDKPGVYRHTGTYGTSYDSDEPAPAEPEVKRGRGRPRKGADSSTGKVPQWDTSTLASWIIGNLPGKLPGKASVKHKLKDWMERVEKNIVTESYVKEGKMAELSAILDDIFSGRQSIAELIARPSGHVEVLLADRLKELGEMHGIDPAYEEDRFKSMIADEFGVTPETLDEVALDPSQVAVPQIKAAATQATPGQQPAGQAGQTQTPTPQTGAAVIDFKDANDPLKLAIQKAVANKDVTVMATESRMFRGTDDGAEKLKRIIQHYPMEHKMAQEGWGIGESFYQALCDHYWDEGRIPREKMHGDKVELRDWVQECYEEDSYKLYETDDDAAGLDVDADIDMASMVGESKENNIGSTMKNKNKQISEKLTKSMTAGEVISDFVGSDDPKFKDKSKAERTKMALGAYYGMHPEKSKKKAAKEDQQMESWNKQLEELLNEGITITTSTGHSGTADSVSISATDSDAQKLMKLVNNAGIIRDHGTDSAHGDSANAAVTVEPVSHDEVMGTLEPVEDDNNSLDFIKRMVGARMDDSSGHDHDGDYESEGEECGACGNVDCECDSGELEEAELAGGQKKLDKAPPFGKLTAADFKELRKQSDVDEGILGTLGGAAAGMALGGPIGAAIGAVGGQQATSGGSALIEKDKDMDDESVETCNECGGSMYEGHTCENVVDSGHKRKHAAESSMDKLSRLMKVLEEIDHDNYAVVESAASKYNKSMHDEIRTATPEKLGSLAREFAGAGSSYADYQYELDLLKSAQAELNRSVTEGDPKQGVTKDSRNHGGSEYYQLGLTHGKEGTLYKNPPYGVGAKAVKDYDRGYDEGKKKQGMAEAGYVADPRAETLEKAFREVDQVMDRAASDQESFDAIRSFSPEIQQQMKDWAMGKVRHSFSDLTGQEAIEQDVYPEADWARAVIGAFKQGVAEEVDTGQYAARKKEPSNKEEHDKIFAKHRERIKNLDKDEKQDVYQGVAEGAGDESEEEFMSRQKRLAAPDEKSRDPKRRAFLDKIPGYKDAMDLAKKTAKGQDVEEQTNQEIDEEVGGNTDAMRKMYGPGTVYIRDKMIHHEDSKGKVISHKFEGGKIGDRVQDGDKDNLAEWANSAFGSSKDEQFTTELNYMTKLISGGLNNIKRDQTTLPSTKVVTDPAPVDGKNSIADLMRKLSDIN